MSFEENEDELSIPFNNNPKKESDFWNNNKKVIILLVSLNLIISGLLTFIIIRLFKEEKNLTVLKSDNEFIKPNITLNAEFELIEMKNGMKGLLIRDPYAEVFHAQFEVENGQLMDTVPGLAHFDEHMIFGGSEKYTNYSFIRNLGGTQRLVINGITDQLTQTYYFSVLYNFNYQKAVDLFIDAFRYPSYNEKVIEKEIQAINSEFYLNIKSRYYILPQIIRQLSSNKTSYNGFGIGNNETLKPYESNYLSKKLKGYHMVVNRPENIFFVLYSNLSIKTLEDFVNEEFDYKMHEFSNNEIDIDDQNKLKENIQTLKKEEIFDENLYEHGIYYKSSLNRNTLNIFFHIGNVDYKDLQFDFIEYIDYLFKSKSLLKILKEKNYILNNFIEIFPYLLLKNNNIVILDLLLTDKGIDEIEKVLLIIYKYIDMMKKEGYKKEYFDNFIKYKQSLTIVNFDKSNFFEDIFRTSTLILQNYLLYGEKQIFTTGAPNKEDYNEKKLKKYLNNIKYEKSFFAVNTKYNKTNISPYLESITKETVNYYKAEFILGKIPSKLKNDINNTIIEELKMRDINPYFSEKNEKVIPCYKKNPNKCKELNEFDFKNEDEYKGTLLEDESDGYVTKYQIDKSSEAFLVGGYFEMNFTGNELLTDRLLIQVEFNYLNYKMNEINELKAISIARIYNSTLAVLINCFSDNIEMIFKDFIELLKQEPKEYEFIYSYNLVKSMNKDIDEISLNQYTTTIAQTFINKGEKNDYNYDTEKFDNLKFEDFKNMNKDIFNSIYSTELKIAGNIDAELVKRLHNIMKEKITIEKTFSHEINTFIPRELSSETPFIINYYEKSKLNNEIDNSILVIYKYDDIYEKYRDILQPCLSNIAITSLRFNYSNSYTPYVTMFSNYIYIYEQGRYKDVTQMEDDINEVLSGMINGNLKCENYKDIIKSFKLKGKNKKEKTHNSLFYDYIYGKNDFPPIDVNYDFPNNFEDLIKEISPIFKEPKRYTILISRSDLLDEDFNKMFENRQNTAKYILNPTVNIQHTKKIDYLNYTNLFKNI